MTTRIRTLPTERRRSVTWDQGNEMALHREFTIATGMQVYFCDPSSSWQRDSNDVRGHDKVPGYGQLMSLLVATKSPRFWPPEVPTPH
jgi:hypothetical protein